MQPGTQPPAGSLYSMSRDELQALKKHLEDNLSKKFVRVSLFSAAALILFVKKPGGDLQFFVDYRGLNVFTIKN